MARSRSPEIKSRTSARFEEIRASHGGEVLDLGEQILLPGLINAHCHLDYTLLRGKIPPQKSFTDWIRAINASKAELSEEDYVASIEAGLAEAQKFGTTALAKPGSLSRVDRRAYREPPLRVWWCAEMIDIRKPVPVREVSENLREWFQSHPEWLGGFGPGAACALHRFGGTIFRGLPDCAERSRSR